MTLLGCRCLYHPASFSILFGQETLPQDAIGGQTEFSNMLIAYDNLTEEKKTEWQVYRQQLRDFPADNADAINFNRLTWPTKPT